MKPISITIRVILGTLCLLTSTAYGGVTLPASAATAPVAAAPAIAGPAIAAGDLVAFQLIAPGSGWALVGQQLFWTDSDGAQWTDITPPDMGPGTIRAANFSDAAHGWAVIAAPAPTGELSYTLERTADGGHTWQSHALALFAPGDAAGMAGDVFLQFLDSSVGWLVVKRATSSNFSVGTLFRTGDGGDHWARLSLPTGAPVRFTNAQDGEIDASATGNGRYATHDGGQTWTPEAGASAPNPAGTQGLSAINMATAQAGWAKSAAGTCEAGICTLVTRLMRTGDGGQTWTAVSLPGGQPAIERSFAAPSAAAAAPGLSVGGLRVRYDGQGFDSCKNDGSLPAAGDMQTWYSNGPYGVWNLYMGGSSRANCGTLTRAYLQQLAQQGWLFIPTWVGPQAPAPCSSLGTRISSDVTTAYNQGVTEATSAINAADNLGLTLADLSGTVIYYDVEYYTDNTTDQSCRAAVKSCISGWTGQLRAMGDQAGVYGAPCGPSMTDYVQIMNVPDMVWLAVWSYARYDPSASVWNITSCGFNNTLWTNWQRLRQYAGGHYETWPLGGVVTFNIDSDTIAGNISTVTDACAPAAGQAALFVYPNYGGQCVLMGIGSYTTTASIGLPAQSISSLRVGGGITVTLFQGESFTPACSIFTTDQADLAGTAVGDGKASSATVITGSLTLCNQVFLPVVAANTSTSILLPNGDFESGPAQLGVFWGQIGTIMAAILLPEAPDERHARRPESRIDDPSRSAHQRIGGVDSRHARPELDAD